MLRVLHYRGLLRPSQGYYAKLKTAFCEKNQYNVLFLGSSRVEMHYDTFMFDSLTGQQAFNLGLAGATPQIAYAALKTYLEKSKAPAYIFYEVDYHSLNEASNEIKDFNNYFPFLGNNTLREQFGRIDSRMQQFYMNPFFSWPFTGYKNLSTSLHGWLNIPNRTDSLYYSGFAKEVLRPHLSYIPSTPYTAFFNVTNRNYLDSIILCCRQHRIYLQLLSSPMFAGGKTGLQNKEQIVSRIGNIAFINHVPYADLSSLPFCNQRNLFVDHYHMNYAGARKFAPYLAALFQDLSSPQQRATGTASKQRSLSRKY